MKGASVHRFGDLVALALPGKGETVYLNPAEARKLARALNAGARSVKTEPRFSQSSFGTIEVPLADPFHKGGN